MNIRFRRILKLRAGNDPIYLSIDGSRNAIIVGSKDETMHGTVSEIINLEAVTLQL